MRAAVFSTSWILDWPGSAAMRRAAAAARAPSGWLRQCLPSEDGATARSAAVVPGQQDGTGEEIAARVGLNIGTVNAAGGSTPH